MPFQLSHGLVKDPHGKVPMPPIELGEDRLQFVALAVVLPGGELNGVPHVDLRLHASLLPRDGNVLLDGIREVHADLSG
jgi:hypothetical protein